MVENRNLSLSIDVPHFYRGEREDTGTAGKTDLSRAELLSVRRNVCVSLLTGAPELYKPGVFFLNLIFMPS